MADWKPDLSEDERKRQFLRWRFNLRRNLGELIWPYLVRNGVGVPPTWSGLDFDAARSIVGLEINLMIKHLQGENAVIKQPAKVISAPKFGSVHLEQFLVEDHPDQPAAINIRDYVADLTDEQFNELRSVVDQAYSSTKLPGLFWFKNAFMRTRPYQASLILGHEDFENYPALSARHSSFYSGHCLEGIVFCAAIEEYWRSKGDLYTPHQFDSLAQYAVDFGDRRVFAGVHYPSDNVGSWIIALSLAQHAFKDPAKTGAFIRRAIVEKSYVFSLIYENYSNFELLAPIWDRLRSELSLNSTSA